MQEESNLFEPKGSEPLAARMRPATLEEFAGQEDILGKGKLLRRAIEADQLSSLILWGPPGSGKTTLGYVIAERTQGTFLTLNAVLAGVADIRKAVDKALSKWNKEHRRTILFIDEVHRFNKAQQDALLPYVENGIIILIGATTENPYFEVIKPLVSRSRIFALRKLSKEEIKNILRRALKDSQRGYGSRNITVTPEALEHMSDMAQGDARSALNALELAVETTSPDAQGQIHIDLDVAAESIQRRALLYDKDGDVHYDTISAFIKSLRGSDPDAALYWLARMVHSGEDPKFIARRMVIFASEDVGMADPSALQVATAAAHAVDYVGLPECQFNLSQACLHLATAPKSNSTMAYFDALRTVREEGIENVPGHLKDPHRDRSGLGHGKGYRYPQAYRQHWVPQQYLPDQLEGRYFYHPTNQGAEAGIQKRLAALRQHKKSNAPVREYSRKERRRKWEEWQAKLHGPGRVKQRDLLLKQAQLNRNSIVLDLGSAGLLGWGALGETPLGRVVSVFSQRQKAAQSTEKSFQWEVDRVFHAVKGKLQFLPFKTGAFNYVLGRHPVSGSPETEVLLSEIVRVLTDGGIFAFVEVLPARRKRLWQEMDLANLPDDLADKAIQAEESLYSSSHTVFSLNEDRLSSMLEQAGFQIQTFDLKQEAERIVVSCSFLKRLFASEGKEKNSTTRSYGDRLRNYLTEEELSEVKKLVYDQLEGKTLKRQTVFAYVTATLGNS